MRVCSEEGGEGVELARARLFVLERGGECLV